MKRSEGDEGKEESSCKSSQKVMFYFCTSPLALFFVLVLHYENHAVREKLRALV
jgi:hypothetical protein